MASIEIAEGTGAVPAATTAAAVFFAMRRNWRNRRASSMCVVFRRVPFGLRRHVAVFAWGVHPIVRRPLLSYDY